MAELFSPETRYCDVAAWLMQHGLRPAVRGLVEGILLGRNHLVAGQHPIEWQGKADCDDARLHYELAEILAQLQSQLRTRISAEGDAPIDVDVVLGLDPEVFSAALYDGNQLAQRLLDDLLVAADIREFPVMRQATDDSYSN